MAPSLEHPMDDAYERALRDPRFLEDVRARYEGGWDVLDALWWSEHPEDAAPSGRAAPLVELRVLQRRLFAADADAVGDPAVAGALRDLAAEIAVELKAIDAAVVAAQPRTSRAPAGVRNPSRLGRSRTALDDDIAAYAAGGKSDEPGEDGELAGAFGPTVRRRLAGYLAAAVVLGGVLGGVIGGLLAGAASPGGTPASSASDFDESRVLALGIFEHRQIASDIPGVPLPSSFHRTTIRAVWSVNWDLAGPRAEPPYFVARAVGNRVCLLVMLDDAHHVSTCEGLADFADSGMQLFWTTDVANAPEGPSSLTGSQNLVLEWSPDGEFAVSSAGEPARTWRRGVCPTSPSPPC